MFFFFFFKFYALFFAPFSTFLLNYISFYLLIVKKFMKGKFFYKIDYNTDNGKKQHRNSKVGKNYHNLEGSGPKAGKTLYFWACIPHFGTDTVEKQGSGCIICAEKAILKDVAGQKNIQEETRL